MSFASRVSRIGAHVCHVCAATEPCSEETRGDVVMYDRLVIFDDNIINTKFLTNNMRKRNAKSKIEWRHTTM